MTAGEPGRGRDRDLLYWSFLQFDTGGRIQQLIRQDTISLRLP